MGNETMENYTHTIDGMTTRDIHPGGAPSNNFKFFHLLMKVIRLTILRVGIFSKSSVLPIYPVNHVVVPDEKRWPPTLEFEVEQRGIRSLPSVDPFLKYVTFSVMLCKVKTNEMGLKAASVHLRSRVIPLPLRLHPSLK